MSTQPDSSSLLSVAAQYGVDYAREKIRDKQLVVLTGAGLSTDSGIPDYRGQGRIKRQPMNFDVFMGSAQAREKYWFRSFFGFRQIEQALPNAGHFALAKAEQDGKIVQLITQNVDGLHQAAGSKNVIDLHGRLDTVRCMGCGYKLSRLEVESILAELNPDLDRSIAVEFNADGDAEIDVLAGFRAPNCPRCGGVLKPDVVFFGESVPSESVAACFSAVDAAQAMLVAGTSLAVNSGLRFVRRAAKAGIPIVIVNLGETKADELATAKIEANTSAALEGLLND
jgi:NAD-dependent SIR2 family protein deacetylase